VFLARNNTLKSLKELNKMKKRLLNEQKTRRFMNLAGIRNLSENFIDETDLDEADVASGAIDEIGDSVDPDMDEPLDMDEPEDIDEPEDVDVPEEEDTQEDEVSGDSLADFLDWISNKVEDYAHEHNIDFDVEVEEDPGDEEDLDPDAEPEELEPEDEEDFGLEGEEEPSMEEELVNEVTRRVALRLLRKTRQ
jgi:hypothetical protein